MLGTCRPEKAARFVFAKISRCCDRANARMMAVSQTLK
jgi:hypothetical protein